MKLTQERLKELLEYDEETGLFTWLVNRSGSAKAGCMAGGMSKSTGYMRVVVDNKIYNSHRLAFLYMKGYMPENEVDHINRIKYDNKWVNLREVSKSCNLRNCCISKNNISGINGVSWDGLRGKWAVSIRSDKKSVWLGYHNTRFEAAKARYEAEVKYGYLDCQINSSALEYMDKIAQGTQTN